MLPLFSAPQCPSLRVSQDIRLSTRGTTILFLNVLKSGRAQARPSVCGLPPLTDGPQSVTPLRLGAPAPLLLETMRVLQLSRTACLREKSPCTQNQFCNRKFSQRKGQAVPQDNETPAPPPRGGQVRPALLSLLPEAAASPSPKFLGQGAVSFSSF